jgi:hypothetical protein
MTGEATSVVATGDRAVVARAVAVISTVAAEEGERGINEMM